MSIKTITATVPASVDVRIGKTDTTVTVDLTRFQPDVLAYVLHYGLKQRLNDVHAALTLKDDGADEINAQVNKALDALYSGDVRIASERIGDPAMQLALREAEMTLAIQYGKRWKGIKNKRELAKDYLSRHPEKVEDARARYAQIVAEAAEVEIPEAAE